MQILMHVSYVHAELFFGTPISNHSCSYLQASPKIFLFTTIDICLKCSNLDQDEIYDYNFLLG